MVGAHLGLRPRKSQSGEDDPQLRITKAGNPLLRRLLVQCANYILGPFAKDSDLRRWGMELMKRGGKNAKKRARVAVARKLGVLMHRLWVTGEVYEPVGYAAKRLVAKPTRKGRQAKRNQKTRRETERQNEKPRTAPSGRLRYLT